MRILTVRQPWAWAIIHGGKDVENRVRNIAGDYRGPVAIHAGMLKDADAHRHPLIMSTWQENRDSYFLHFGAVIGVVDLVDVHRANGDNPGELNLCAPHGLCSAWAEPKGFHLVLANPRPLAETIPYSGALGLRTLDEATAAAVLEAIA